ncbi:MAG TPA: PEP-CTERM sorting domain-containing protein [Gammaproteobacteria bacterium]|nr:PEP-CTERM sorting domain-containing protein [Gammaproteobacteria bacterium]
MNKSAYLCGLLLCWIATTSEASLITDPNDPRSWQGATVGTFATLFYGSDTLATRQQVVDNQLLDDGVFDPSGFSPATLVSTPWSTSPGAGGCRGISYDLTGTGGYSYACIGGNLASHANTIDNLWFQSSSQVGDTVFDLGFQASKAAVFSVIDHGPLPNEAIESTVYLSNDLVNWTQAVVERVWLEGFMGNTGILWDGFTYAVGTGTNATFRYASVINGGPGALQRDGDDEINGIMGLRSNFAPGPGPGSIPEPASVAMILLGLMIMTGRLRRS